MTIGLGWGALDCATLMDAEGDLASITAWQRMCAGARVVIRATVFADFGKVPLT